MMGHAYADYFSKAYIVSYRKKAETDQIHRFISWQNPFKVKNKYLKKIKQFQSSTCYKHSRPLSNNYWPVIAVLQLCAEGMATV